MAKSKTKKKKSTFGKICTIVVDILVIPVIVLAFACTIFTFSAKANNKVPKIFGKSIVTVLSESMEPDYKVGDVLIISEVKNLDTLKIGDNIAFYAPIWLGYPFTTTLDNGEKVSNVIYHQIVDIIWVQDSQNVGAKIRHFVCRGTNLSAPSYTYVGEGNGNYKMTETWDGVTTIISGEDKTFTISQGTGDWDIVLENLPATSEDQTNTSNIGSSSMSTMQYITDEYVVGIYDSSLSPAIGGFIKFSSSSLGLLCMVIIPASLMAIFVIVGLVKEVRESKEDEEEDQLAMETNMSALKETSLKVKEEMANKEAPKQKQVVVEEKPVDIQSVIGGVVSESKATAPKTTQTTTQTKSTTAAPTGSAPKTSAKMDSNSASATKVAAPKTASATKTAPIKATTTVKPTTNAATKPTTTMAAKLQTTTKPATTTATKAAPAVKPATAKPPVKKAPPKKAE